MKRLLVLLSSLALLLALAACGQPAVESPSPDPSPSEDVTTDPPVPTIALPEDVRYFFADGTFLGSWSDFLGPLIYINNERNYTLTLGLYAFVSEHSVDWHLLMAASVVFVIPVIIIFFFAQKQFIEGITLTGIKG